MATKLDTQIIKNLKKPGSYTDALAMGLHLWVKDRNKKYWIYRYTIGGKQKNIGLGPYPDVGLADARIKAIEAKKKVVNGIDPKPQKETRTDTEPHPTKYAPDQASPWHSLVCKKRLDLPSGYRLSYDYYRLSH